ncbi:uncharacterized protein BDR25DRAFT_154604, partial [Lindgomyces ingoldianus]
MTDPLSVAASVVSITIPALHGTRLLLDDLEKLKDAPKSIKRLVDDVQSVDAALQLLRGVEDREWESLGTSVAEQSKSTISTCAQACDHFRTNLQRWTRHSEDGKLAWQDRANVGFFKQGQMKAISEQLQNCKLTINSVVSIATLYSSIRHVRITEEIKRTICTKQAEVEGAITTADKQLIILENKLEELDLSSDDEKEARSNEDKADAIWQLEEERKALVVSRGLLGELLSKSQEEAIAKAAGNHSHLITVVFGNQNSGIQAGTISGGVSGISFG